MKRVPLVLLVLVLATSMFFSCDQKEEESGGGGTGVGVADPSTLPSYTGTIPSDDSYIIMVLSDIVDEIAYDVYDVSDNAGYYDELGWTSNYNETVAGYYGGTASISGTEREAESETATSGSYSWTSNVNVQLDGYLSYYDAAASGVGETGERENGAANKDSGAYSWSVLYEFGFSVSVSGTDLAGKYILFMSAGASESGTIYSPDEFWYRYNNLAITGTGYLRIYDNANNLVREVTLTQSQMEMLYPDV